MSDWKQPETDEPRRDKRPIVFPEPRRPTGFLGVLSRIADALDIAARFSRLLHALRSRRGD